LIARHSSRGLQRDRSARPDIRTSDCRMPSSPGGRFLHALS
jgi:hypothetical protein